MKFRPARIALSCLAVAAALFAGLTAADSFSVADGPTTISAKPHTHLVLSARPKVGVRALRPGSQRAATLAGVAACCLLAAAGVVAVRHFRATPVPVLRAVRGRAPPLPL